MGATRRVPFSKGFLPGSIQDHKRNLKSLAAFVRELWCLQTHIHTHTHTHTHTGIRTGFFFIRFSPFKCHESWRKVKTCGSSSSYRTYCRVFHLLTGYRG